MDNKMEILMHPVRMKICLALMGNKENGLTPLEMVKVIKDVPQATLYRHIQSMVEADVIQVLKEKKVKSVTEKYYVLNEDYATLDKNEWGKVSAKEKLDYISYYQLLLLSKYQLYLQKLEGENRTDDNSTFSVVEFQLDEEHFTQFQNELNKLVTKYYHASSKKKEKSTPTQTIGITIIPDS
ncbi:MULTISPECIES: helix-turn-helix domain-containing protein [Bacillaceae]|jgi:hypothetical protein|uniref:HTH arsR-type domain-containing protein n=3 Tax=Bacillaceae TaxID=186817 RepID=A0A090IU56_9BACI|nr:MULTISPECIES: helix-turn-helix domain-containing protein [Bacillaceae]KIO63944.1 hypothetical protein B4064_2924 [Caldibacillus thermoamylovorans]MCM3055908.1 helix-turn-helix domain-containing protein [Caldibacillus thermoamylovorans]MEC5271601.1 helix-turn-helix domain-containing protein [Caldifermentibacillus hisashii]NCU19006.1 helix-turn-helix domain-containing protein [Pallidibacillus pasinlerensis]PAC33616.1 transcriptional regulator [Caldifermentibacillus hisashii]